VRAGSQVAISLTYGVVDKRTRVLLSRVEVLAVGTYSPVSTRDPNRSA
jgi:hypothetical protein